MAAKKKIVGMDEVLDKAGITDPEERGKLAAAIKERLENLDLKEESADHHRVQMLPDDASKCPSCGGKLRFHERSAMLPLRDGSGHVPVQFGECRACMEADKPCAFMRKALS